MQIFRLPELPLEDFALSLGLATAPRVPGVETALENAPSKGRAKGSQDEGSVGDGNEEAENEKQREEARSKKNVNRSLQRLKEQIKTDKLRKRMEVRISVIQRRSGRICLVP